jgi:hypothetical protein
MEIFEILNADGARFMALSESSGQSYKEEGDMEIKMKVKMKMKMKERD